MQDSPEPTLSYASDIRPLFRQRDIDSMLNKQLDLSSYADVSARANDILGRLESGSMPCDGAWPKENVDLFSKWIEQGKRP